MKSVENTAFSSQSKCLTHSATEKSTRPIHASAKVLVDFSRLAREWAARFHEIGLDHCVSTSIEMLDAFRYGKINPPHARLLNKLSIQLGRANVPFSQ
jgi:hypothetical protein